MPNDKILHMTKLKAFADDKLNYARVMISLLDRVENTVGKGENAGYQHFPLFLQFFPKPSSLGSLKVGIELINIPFINRFGTSLNLKNYEGHFLSL